MKHRIVAPPALWYAARRALVLALTLVVGTQAWALKHAAPGPRIPVDPSIPSCRPGPLKIEPEEEFNLVGADVMDEITLGWVKLFRQAYPRLSVTMEARASALAGCRDSYVPVLESGRTRIAARPASVRTDSQPRAANEWLSCPSVLKTPHEASTWV